MDINLQVGEFSAFYVKPFSIDLTTFLYIAYCVFSRALPCVRCYALTVKNAARQALYSLISLMSLVAI